MKFINILIYIRIKLGIGDWGLGVGIGDWGQWPNHNTQYPRSDIRL